MEERRSVPPDPERSEHSVEQREVGEAVDSEGAPERQEQADEGVLRDSDQGVGGQFE